MHAPHHWGRCVGSDPTGNGKKTWGYHGVMERNVVWNCNGIMVKGNNHSITRNTIFDTDPLNFESDGCAGHPEAEALATCRPISPDLARSPPISPDLPRSRKNHSS